MSTIGSTSYLDRFLDPLAKALTPETAGTIVNLGALNFARMNWKQAANWASQEENTPPASRDCRV